jgi:hypothetical protein
MRHGRPEGGERRDADICACAGGRGRGGQNYDRQADIAEDQPDEAARERGEKAPEGDAREQ